MKGFEAAGFKSLEKDVQSRNDPRMREPGDDELLRLLGLVKALLRGPEAEVLNNQERVSFHGLDCRDIVDLLPIEAFPSAAAEGRTWADLWNRQPQIKGDTFKRKFGIHEESVRAALSSGPDFVHPELQRLYDAIVARRAQ